MRFIFVVYLLKVHDNANSYKEQKIDTVNLDNVDCWFGYFFDVLGYAKILFAFEMLRFVLLQIANGNLKFVKQRYFSCAEGFILIWVIFYGF